MILFECSVRRESEKIERRMKPLIQAAIAAGAAMQEVGQAIGRALKPKAPIRGPGP